MISRPHNHQQHEDIKVEQEDYILQHLPTDIINAMDDESRLAIQNANTAIAEAMQKNKKKDIAMDEAVSQRIYDEDSILVEAGVTSSNPSAVSSEEAERSIANNDAEDMITTQIQFEAALCSLIALPDSGKWEAMGLDNFSRLFGDTETIKRNFTVIELKALIAASSQPLKGVKLKNELVNIVSSICASGQHIKATASPKSLAALITDTMRKWPRDAITALYASEIFFTKFAQWMSTHPFKSEKIILTEDRHVYNIPNWYSQLDSICGGLVTYILDPHHIFVNNRSRCCTYGMPCRVWESVTKAWHKVAQNEHDNETGLSMELVCEVRDRQRHYFAQLTFSEKVEEIMLKNGDCEESHWVKLIRVLPCCWWSRKSYVPTNSMVT